MSTFREALEPFAERAPRPGALEQERPVTITVTAGQLYAARAALSALDAAGGAGEQLYVRGTRSSDGEVEVFAISPAPVAGVAVPEGWQLVPKEPTFDMQKAGRDEHQIQEQEAGPGKFVYRTEICAKIYRAMLAAAPAAHDGGKG